MRLASPEDYCAVPDDVGTRETDGSISQGGKILPSDDRPAPPPVRSHIRVTRIIGLLDLRLPSVVQTAKSHRYKGIRAIDFHLRSRFFPMVLRGKSKEHRYQFPPGLEYTRRGYSRWRCGQHTYGELRRK